MTTSWRAEKCSSASSGANSKPNGATMVLTSSSTRARYSGGSPAPVVASSPDCCGEEGGAHTTVLRSILTVHCFHFVRAGHVALRTGNASRARRRSREPLRFNRLKKSNRLIEVEP